MTDEVGVRASADLAGAAATARGGVRATDGAEAAMLSGETGLSGETAGLSEETAERLRAAGLDVGAVVRVVRAALDEDFRYGPDVTSAATVGGRTVTADVVAREAGVLAGVPVALAVLDLIAEYLGEPDAVGGPPWRTGLAAGGGRRWRRTDGSAGACW